MTGARYLAWLAQLQERDRAALVLFTFAALYITLHYLPLRWSVKRYLYFFLMLVGGCLYALLAIVAIAPFVAHGYLRW